MGERRLFAAMVTAALLVSCDQSQVKNQSPPPNESKRTVHADVIYGADDRLDLYEVQNPLLLDLAGSTVALMQNRDLQRQPDGSYKINAVSFGSSYGLCRTEPYYDQKIAAFCSGFLVAPDAIATAGHCIRNDTDCRNTKFVFGFAATGPGRQTESVSENQVYSCSQILATEIGSGGHDFAVVRLDRPVLGKPVLELRPNDDIKSGDAIVVIGHPAGLPVKVAGGAAVRSVSAEFFTANLDTYGGNSGSAVFNAQTGEVEGILVRGENDFVSRNGCRVSNQCTDSSCRGEDVTKISYVRAVLSQGSGGGATPQDFEVAHQSAVAIPDNKAAGIQIKLKADQAPQGRRVLVAVDIEHSWRGDLRVSLVAPNGAEVVLHNRTGGSQHDLRGTFGKDLTSAQDLSTVTSISLSGTWVLKVADLAKQDVGTVKSVRLQFVP